MKTRRKEILGDILRRERVIRRISHFTNIKRTLADTGDVLLSVSMT